MNSIIVKIIIAIICLIVIGVYLAPILTGFFPPFGVILLILLFCGVLAWLMGYPRLP